MARGILVSYGGYPYTTSSLMPDNGLANLLGSLFQSGHSGIAMDYGTVDTIRRLVPAEISGQLKELYRQFGNLSKDNSQEALNKKQEIVRQLRKIDSLLSEHQTVEVKKIGEELSDLVRMEHADFVGFKIYTGDAYLGSVEMAKVLKKNHPSLKIYAGGPTIDIMMQTILKDTNVFDVLAFAEGEEIIVNLAEFAEGKGSLNFPNIIRSDGTQTELKRVEDLNSMPFPLYHEEVYPSMKGNQKLKIMMLDESRGCPNVCNFCAQPIKSGKQRVKNPERVFSEIEYLIDACNSRALRFAGSSTPIKLTRAVADKILEKNLKVIYSGFGHVRESDEDFHVLRRSGLLALLFGVESGSQKILDALNKANKVEQIEYAFKVTKEAGIFRVGSIILPAPYDTQETMEETFNFILKIRPDSVFILPPGIFPRTPWAVNPKRFGLEIDMENEHYKEFFLKYKLKTLFPPSLWEPLPYKVNGMGYPEYSRITEKFAERLESNGIVTRLTDDILIMADVLRKDVMEFKRQCSEFVYTGNHRELYNTIEDFNKAVGRQNAR